MPTDPPPPVNRAALYLRISTQDGRQTEENQRRELKALLKREGYVFAGEFVDHESGRKGRRERAGFNDMFEAAERGAFDVLVFWSLDRFSREGIRTTIHYLQQLETLGVRFRSYTEPYLNTENELVSHILLAVMSYFAEYEAKKISRRTKAGLERARSEGKKIGRPSKFHQQKDTLIKLQQQGASKADMKRQTGLAYNTVKSYLKRLDEGA
jgi:DNA invertase Pin-like site-specific DNA recombinase